eukprot:7107696-Pyramimonas_sp.AAC.1
MGITSGPAAQLKAVADGVAPQTEEPTQSKPRQLRNAASRLERANEKYEKAYEEVATTHTGPSGAAGALDGVRQC